MRFNTKINTEQSKVKYFVTSDLHFFHKNIIKHCPKTRPYSSVDEMNEALILYWNTLIGKNDVVFHLGDFSGGNWTKTAELISRLNGKIIFIIGNHDKVLRDNLPKEDLHDYFELWVNKVKVCMSHYPMTCWNQAGRGSIMLYGHTHGSFQGKGRTMDVGWDACGKILPIEMVVGRCLAMDIYTPDHH